ncbi:MAG TPA: hypothetical protein VF414_21680 [Thermoanaerobaculia bacterium]
MRTPFVVLLLLILATFPVHAQEPEETPVEMPAPEATPSPEPAPPEPAPGETPAPAEVPAGEEEPRPKPPNERFLPRLDVYFPEGDLDLRVNRLINKVFFEGQVKYNFIKGDISAFLRYRYYGFQRVTQFTVFDEIEFEDVEDFSSDFDRTRGTLLLLQWPHSYHQRTFLLAELDRISSNKEGVAEILRLGRTNTFLRFGYQLGTPEDARSNAIVGETRARSERLFTAFREIGPGGFGFTGAVTSGFDIGIGDFDYLKLETEVLKRFDVTERTFLVGRVHAGSFPRKGIRDLPGPAGEFDEFDELAIPRSEFFRLDGRENLKGLDERLRGTEEIHTTWEYFFPWFLGADHKFLKLTWQNWYWIVYGGMGNIGLDTDIYTDFGEYVPDVGIGFESSFNLRKYRFFLSGIVAQALKGDGGVEARVSVKSYR